MSNFENKTNEVFKKSENDEHGNVVIDIEDLKEVPKVAKWKEKKVYRLHRSSIDNYIFYGNGRCMTYMQLNGKPPVKEDIRMINSSEVLSLLPQIQRLDKLKKIIEDTYKSGSYMSYNNGKETIDLGSTLGGISIEKTKIINKKSVATYYGLSYTHGEFALTAGGMSGYYKLSIDQINQSLDNIEKRITEYKKDQNIRKIKLEKEYQQRIDELQQLSLNDAKDADQNLDNLLSKMA